MRWETILFDKTNRKFFEKLILANKRKLLLHNLNCKLNHIFTNKEFKTEKIEILADH